MIWRMLALASLAVLIACGSPRADAPPPSPAIWQVTAPSGENGWLIGTIHALPDDSVWRSDAFEAAERQSRSLIVEIANPGDPATQALFARLSTTPGQPDLLQRVPPADRPSLEALVDEADMEAAQFSSVETWGVALMLAGAVSVGEPANGVDLALVRAAETANRPVAALETAEQQLRLFDGLSEPHQSALLASTAREAANDPKATIAAWLAGDLVRLEALSKEGVLAYPALYETLLHRRNLAWVEQVDGAVRAGNRPLVAVGTAHMLGADGLPALLSTRGYTVFRIQ